MQLHQGFFPQFFYSIFFGVHFVFVHHSLLFELCLQPATRARASSDPSPPCMWELLGDDLLRLLVQVAPIGTLPLLARLQKNIRDLARKRMQALAFAVLREAPFHLADAEIRGDDVERLGLSGQIGDVGFKSLSAALSNGALPGLKELWLSGNQIGVAGMKSFSEALASGALKQLDTLALHNNQISDLTAFSAALARGALKQLTMLFLNGNQISDLTSFSAALASGALPQLKKLVLTGNKISDLTSFSEALASGALRQLKYLGLEFNQIGNDGLSACSRALASGALPRLEIIFVDNPPKQLQAFCSSKRIKLSV